MKKYDSFSEYMATSFINLINLIDKYSKKELIYQQNIKHIG